MDFGLCLPNFQAGSSTDGLERAAATAERLGWSTIWTTDHLLVVHEDAPDYGRTYEAILTLAWLGARHPTLRLGTSVIIAAVRNAVILAKEFATLDALSDGRVIAGIGVGWSHPEFANLGMADRFVERGAYLDETIALWRHLWSGATTPFHGRFHAFDDFVFEPLPAQGDRLPIITGGRAAPALRRAGRLADGYHSSQTGPRQYAERLPVIRAAAEAAGRPMPWLSGRVNVRFGPGSGDTYAIAGTPDEMAAEVRAFAALGVEHLALAFGTREPDALDELGERFMREVAPLV